TNPCPRCGCIVPVKLAKGGQYPGHHYMHCQSCKNHYVFPMISSTPAMPAQCSRMPRPTKGCAQLLCPKAPHRSCPNTMCKLCCIDRMGGCI
ncbi:hypothetical protein L208DRAFT_1206439, partial [Tricholoma matsutake]